MNVRRLCLEGLKLASIVAICALTISAAAKDPGEGNGWGAGGRCPRSPENPTIVLGLLSTAAVAWQYLRARKNF